MLGFAAGMLLGSLAGAILSYERHGFRDMQSSILSVNQPTGQARLHIKGQPQLPELRER